ncbi:hypothetical protein MIND_00820800 [Mycena indigotica]|uniref:F-box domain-containing protein n=1 Tax=Mycena indigotica TaxID=2126181 RepID=A0A8H6SGW0_9AGAR|nr:uncharacterized protein MIND_00820800 [Mycena indigotica]KAF7298733.1 hypothetical protein MIND_00820800 [Mycena indigotica]
MSPTPTLSPFATLLGSNQCPTDSEAAEIRSFLVEPISRAQTLATKMLRLDVQHKELMAHITAHRALLSPIRRLPQDVLREIFTEFLSRQKYCGMKTFDGPILLGRICSQWRSLALETPELWSRLHVVEPAPSAMSRSAHSTRTMQLIDGIKLWLDRAGSRPLYLSFQREPSLRSPLADNHSSVLDLLISYAPRCKAICTPFLEDVTIEIRQFVHSNGETPSPWQSLLFLRAASLRKLTLSDCVVKNLQQHVNWTKLTHLTISEHMPDHPVAEKLPNLLTKCSELRVCILKLEHWDIMMPIAISPNIKILLNHLNRLHLSSHFHLLPNLVLPELRYLILRYKEEEPWFDEPENDILLENVDDLLSTLQSSTQLEVIRFASGLPKQGLLTILATLPPSLLTLEIADNQVDPQIDDKVLERLAETRRCPKLQNLTLRKCELVSEEGMVQYLNLQTDGLRTVSLRKLFVRYNVGLEPPWTSSAPERIRPFQDAGIQICLTKSDD